MNKSLRWRVLAIVAVVALGAWAIYPPAQKIRLGLDLKGGVHLVLRVQTDDALRLETETAMNRLREELVKAGAAGVTATALEPDVVSDCRRSGRAGRRAAPGGHRGRGDVQPRVGCGRHVRVPHEAEHRQPDPPGDGGSGHPHHRAPRQRARRRRAHRRAPGRRRIRSSSSCPVSSDVARAKEIIKSTSLLELTLVEAGPASTREQLLTASGGMVPSDAEVLPGVASAAAGQTPAGVVYYLLKKTPVVSGRDLRNARPSIDENNRPAVQFYLKPDGATRFGQFTGSNLGRNLAIVLDERVVIGAGHRGPDHRRGPHFRQLHAAGSHRPGADAALGRAAGLADVSRGADRRPVAGRRLDSRRRHGVDHRPDAGDAVHARLLQAVGHERHPRDGHQPAGAAGADGLFQGDDDAAGHCRVHPDDRHGRGLQRPDLRAHQGRTGAPPRARARPSPPASIASS